MVLATSNKAKELLSIRHVGRVTREQLRDSESDLEGLLAGLPKGFRVLVDFSQMESMDEDAAAEIGRMMEIIDLAGVSMVVRVFPDPTKDIGMNILSLFHYSKRPRFVTCDTIEQAVRALSL